MTASILKRAADWLDDYADVYKSCVIGDGSWPDDRKNIRDMEEMQSLARQLRSMDDGWQSMLMDRQLWLGTTRRIWCARFKGWPRSEMLDHYKRGLSPLEAYEASASKRVKAPPPA